MLDVQTGWIRFSLEPQAPFRAPAFDGSMLRGGFGHALRRLVCVMRQRDCAGCPLESGCMYVRLFETRSDWAAEGRYRRAPHPFVLRGNLRDRRGEPVERIDFRMTLFGAALADAPFVARAVEEAAARGFGPDRTRFALREIAVAGQAARTPEQGYPLPAPAEDPPPLPERVRMVFVTPVRLTRQGRPVDAGTLDGPTLGRAILRRVGLMATFHGQGADALDFAALSAEADAVRIVDRNLRWRKLVRRSARQKARQAIGGIVGEVSVDFADAPGIGELARWLPAMHLGKGTSMGLGQVEIVPDA
ncbi:CRISPR system precrRNA processing endoribonuclease RAMP protein Cas6 [Jhaorihella thermophila]|nr:CRISPR system precrRNA processing endoribonuclease RAMP protein Cas6 [Jhaorihella thermophila]